MIEYKTKGTCSRRITFAIEDGKVRSVSFKGGCEGNLKALSLLVEGMDGRELVNRLKGIRCGRKGTSCADQLAQAVDTALPGNG
ncbi:MAG: TIGR03905 family TSCPD domain-containing protein [Spirochaetaceae bacterium]|jgi:uncharacterized protein (TIGR03905 family)|nr:TIGR03905 family TSCPD domain-containing protein [Spirochaetaceae bacterium]